MKRIKCEECGGRIIEKKVKFDMYSISLGEFDAQVCDKCGEVCFDEEVSDEIDKKAKEKGLWGLSAQTKISKVGTSVAITINKKIAEFMDLKKGEEVNIHPENKQRLIIDVLETTKSH